MGFLPPEAREAIGLDWSDAQERRLRLLGLVARAVVPALPERLRYLPLAREARRAHRAGNTHRAGHAHRAGRPAR
ncbi:oxygenase MpaB family protein [Streptomyces sudanensis]|uniref:oxygenase MpaB family protein n=1 Tax=Streptomyces sudanensis TaxID=436397 RepID=UPI003557F49E